MRGAPMMASIGCIRTAARELQSPVRSGDEDAQPDQPVGVDADPRDGEDAGL